MTNLPEKLVPTFTGRAMTTGPYMYALVGSTKPFPDDIQVSLGIAGDVEFDRWEFIRELCRRWEAAAPETRP